jgi:probable HAF family extracellular repeat protein
MKSRTLITALTLFAALSASVRLAAQDAQDRNQKHTRYSIKVLDTLGGTFGEAWGVNNRGLVAGMSTTTGDTALDAFLWSKGVITDVGSLGEPISLTFTKPNERGEVAGYSNTSAPDPNGEDFCNGLGTFLICLPFVWEKGVMTALPTLGGTNGQALGINNRGQIVGEAETPNVDPCSPFALQVEAVVWRDHQIEQYCLRWGVPSRLQTPLTTTEMQSDCQVV